MRLYKESEKATLSYWFAHWLSYQRVALLCGVWKPKYLLHDIEKPWLMLIWRDYPRVKAWHRSHTDHHLEHIPFKKYDWEAMVIDWECSRFTKEAAPLNAQETMYIEMQKFPEIAGTIRVNCGDIIKALHLWNDNLKFENYTLKK